MAKSFSIRYKFLLVTTLLLIVCVGAYLLMATTVFKRDKTEFVFDYNRSLVSNLSSDIETLFRGVSDKMKLVAYFFREDNPRSLRVVKELLANESDLVFVAGSDRFKELDRVFHTDRAYLETYDLPEGYFLDDLNKTKSIPFARIQKEGEAIWNATTENGPPLIGFGKSVVEESEDGRDVSQYAVVAYVKADKLIKALSRGRLNEVFVTNGQGEVLVHSEDEVLRTAGDAPAETLVQEAIRRPYRTSVMTYEEQGEEFLGAFSKAFNDRILVVSRVSEGRAFAVVDRLILRSIAFALMVLTMAFIAAILFSRSLTKPLEVLMGGMKRVADGFLDTRIEVRTRDEIRVLAGSFNSMIDDLRQSREELEEINRDLEDKVKERTQQLEKQNQAVKNAQEALLRTSRLAAVGEIAGRAAHEVLNPLTSIMSRVQKVNERLESGRMQEVKLLEDIRLSWERDYASGGFDSLVKAWCERSAVQEDMTLWDEDMANLKALSHQIEEERHSLITDAQFLLRESQRINRIVQSMRSLSVVNAELKRCSLRRLLEDSVDIMADLASQMEVTVKIEGSWTDESEVTVDEDEFIQAFTNLLRNSLQAVRQRREDSPSNDFQGEVVISGAVTDSGYKIYIRDNGVGISEENKKRLFENQFSTKPREEGTGLGLNISRRFIRAFGGDIVLKWSEVGQGTEFAIELPLQWEAKTKVSA